MVDIIEEILQKITNGSLIPNSKKSIIKNNCKMATKLINKTENKGKFYSFGETVVIHNIEIKDPLVYIDSGFDFSINSTLKISAFETSNSHNYGFLSDGYSDLTQRERYNYLIWLASGRYAEKYVQDTFLVLFFRGLQYRSVAEEKDLKIILFELLKFFEFYFLISYYYFKENILTLIVYLIFKTNENFEENEQNILLEFIKKFKNTKSIITDNFESLIIKIKNITPEFFIQKEFDISNEENFLLNIYKYIQNKIFNSTGSKFFNFKGNLFHKSYKKQPLLLVAFKILLNENSLSIYNQKDFKFSFDKLINTYSNYYLPKKYEKQYEKIKFDLTLSLKIKKIFFEASQIVQEYEEKRSKISFLKQGKYLNDKEKYSILSEKLRKYFDVTIIPKKKKLTTEELNSIPIEYNINIDKLTLIKQDTSVVKNILTEIFYENDEEILVQQKTKISRIKINNNESEILEEKYLKFMNFLKEKEVWTEKELKNYCRENKLMLANAISTINEYYDLKYNDYLIEENGDFYINLKLK